MAAENPKRLLEYLAEGLVDDPEAVSVEQFEEDDGTVVLELCVGADDYGRVIGRGGRTAHALRDGRQSRGGRRGPPRARRHRRLTPPARPCRLSGLRVRGRVGRAHGLDGSFYVTRAERAAAERGRDRDGRRRARRDRAPRRHRRSARSCGSRASRTARPPRRCAARS